MLGRITFIILTALLIAGVMMMTALPALADEAYSLDKDFKRANSNIVIHLKYVSVTDKYIGNIYPSLPIDETKWAHLVYQYENTGDKAEIGHIQYELIDTKGNLYTLPLGEYSGVTVQPHSMSDIRWNEIPIPRDAVLARVRVFVGTNPNFLLANETYDLQLVGTSTPSVTPAGPSAVEPSPGVSSAARGCMPLLPFATMASLGIVGLYVKGKGIKK